MPPKDMNAVILKAPYEVAVESRPMPQIMRPSEAIIKVSHAGLCGSDLHLYRGHQPVTHYGFILGHEVLGEIYQVGEGVKKFKVGDKVISPFSTSCGECFYCEKGYTSRCIHGSNFGNHGMEGGQAEYFKIYMADTTLFHLPTDISPDLMVIMTDILPTAYYVADNAVKLAAGALAKDSVCAVVGCGPVGLCAITCATHMFGKVFATDLRPERRAHAQRHGAIVSEKDELIEAVLKATQGRGADAVLEVVGTPGAMQLAIEMTRPYGVISSCGIHTHDPPMGGLDMYNKNLRFQFGRCSVRNFYSPALNILKQNKELFSTFVENKVPLSEAPKYYKLFNENKIAKTVFITE